MYLYFFKHNVMLYLSNIFIPENVYPKSLTELKDLRISRFKAQITFMSYLIFTSPPLNSRVSCTFI